MKILIDSSTLYSTIAFPRKEHEIVKSLVEKHTIVTTTYIKEELERNFKKSFSGKRKKEILFELEMFISECEIKTTQEYVDYLQEAKEKISLKDAPILACGMLPDIDYLITSDKEFFEIEIDKVKILSPGDARCILL